MDSLAIVPDSKNPWLSAVRQVFKLLALCTPGPAPDADDDVTAGQEGGDTEMQPAADTAADGRERSPAPRAHAEDGDAAAAALAARDRQDHCLGSTLVHAAQLLIKHNPAASGQPWRLHRQRRRPRHAVRNQRASLSWRETKRATSARGRC